MQETQAMTETSAAAEADRVLRLERTFAAPRDVVFRAWTDPGELAKWWGPESVTAPTVEMDLRPGGAWRTCMTQSDGGEMWVRGQYQEIDAPERLVFTWAWETDGVPGDETTVTVEFLEQDGATRIVLTQRLFADREACENHHKGWSSSFDCLDEIL